VTLGLAAALSGLTAIALVILLVPLFRRRYGAASREDYNLAELVEECAIATNTAAAGGNASLMAIG